MKKRDYLRVPPSGADPVKVSFMQEELKGMAPFIKVRNISIGGVMIQISDAVAGRDGLLPSGTLIEQIRIFLPRQGVCELSGIVRFTYGSLRGIEFLRNEPEQKRLARYVHQRQVELLGHDTSKWPEEKAFEYRQTGGLYNWLMESQATRKGAMAPRELPRGGADAAEKKKILIIDPSASGRESYSAIFSGADFEAYADGGPKAEELALGIKPDLVLMDFCGPAGLDCGWQILKKLKSSRDMGGVPVFLVTDGDRETAHMAIQHGVDDHIIKSGNPESVLERIRDFFGIK
ncbi:MAG: response regulator [Nitrospiraceae bacterium]|nr:response regulator [Nitrospiraceae bacterium]